MAVVSTPSDMTDAAEALVRESLFATVLEGSPNLTIVDASAELPATERSVEALSRAARERAADGWFRVHIAGEEEELSVEATVYSLRSQSRTAELSYTVDLGASIRTLGRRTWAPLTDALAQSEPSTTTKITIEGPPETVVTNRVGTTVGVIPDDGALTVELAQPGTYRLNARRDGYYPGSVDVFLQSTPQTVDLALTQRSPVQLNWYLQGMSYPGFDFTYLIGDTPAFLRAGGFSYNFGIVPFAHRERAEERRLVVSEPLTRLRLLGGVYLQDATSTVRGYVAGGPYIRLMNASYYTGLEPVVPWGVETILGMELPSERRLRVFMEYAPSVGFASDEESLRGQVAFNEGIRPFAAGSLFVDLLAIRVGVRLQP